MIETKHILKLNVFGNNTEDQKCLSMISTNKTNGFLLGTPGLVSKKQYENDKNNIIKVLFPFPSRYTARFGYCFSSPKDKYIVTEKLPLPDRHKTEKIEVISAKLKEEIIHSTRENRAISYVVEDLQAQGESIYIIKDIINSFKYHSIFSYNIGMPISIKKESNDRTMTIFTFYSLTDSIAIFNERRIDGFGISINNISKDVVYKLGYIPDQLEYTNTHIVVSNYLDNIFEIDGSAVNDIEPIENGTYETIAEIISTVSLDKGDPDKKKKKSGSSPNVNYY